MPRRKITLGSERWTATLSGRRTQYTKDEFTVVFARVDGGPPEQRVARYSPLGSKSRESSLGELTDEQLRDLLRRSQPSWTTPELDYRR